ncbi:trypsin-like peptidase domain-containing protein [Rhizobium mongolense]|uniref:Serine protease DegQ n=1 Tax=Rhizobium mongolense TaxID=57676 RepID=A0ABR6IGZ1_9HYPH|nr:trypsin-like peptidase domain-containing protein [Rhizobium mongolense]MBB4227030.1 serine protease DegQ [Rhizobium mongolense]
MVSRSPTENNPLYNDPYFRRYFNLPEQQPQARMSAGSGVIVDADKGYVLTNHHVVDGGTEISVTLKDGRQLLAKLIGSDKETDIALLQIDAKNLTAIQIGDSDTLKVGDYVVAIGNPFGLGQTVTSGIVSALGRSGLNIEGYEDFIQTDASINPGNSGGALVTLDGKLIGVNSQYRNPQPGRCECGYRLRGAEQHRGVRNEPVDRPRRGAAWQAGHRYPGSTPDLAEALNLGGLRGALVANVERGSAADRAGVKSGDVVTAIDGRQVRGATDLRNRIGLTPAGSKIRLTVKRSDDQREIEVPIASEDRAPADFSGTPLDGARLRDASAAESGAAGVSGVVIASVAAGSVADRAGLRAGDMVVAVNRIPVTSVAELRRAISKKAAIAALELFRDGARFLLVIR